MGLFFKTKAEKLQNLIDTRDDLRAYLIKWGFGLSPSEKRKIGVRIEEIEVKIEKLERR